MRTVSVSLGERSYPIYIGKGLLTDQALMSRFVRLSKAMIITNSTVGPLYLKQLGLKGTDVVVLPDGEKYKNIETLTLIFDSLLEKNFNRSSVLIALGGGVVGDMVGFAAACYQRGIDFIQVPTTLLAQVDSSVGGKTGVNHSLGKNMVGAFHQPRCVLIDTDTLATLPEREYTSGLAEIIKYGLITDGVFFSWLESNIQALLNRDSDALEYAIEMSCTIKAQLVAEDEKEQGRRALLNLGHTFGHAIEAWQGYKGYLHGEAVAVGIVMAAAISNSLKMLSGDSQRRVVALLKKARLPVVVPSEMTGDSFVHFMSKDKKNTDTGIRLILLTEIGHALVYEGIEHKSIQEVVRFMHIGA